MWNNSTHLHAFIRQRTPAERKTMEQPKSDRRLQSIGIAPGIRIRQLRAARGWTQKELARRIAAYIRENELAIKIPSHSSVSSWEQTKIARVPSVDMLRVLAAIFNVTMDDILCSSGEEDAKNA